MSAPFKSLSKIISRRKPIVFFDFDNTITPFDILDEIIKQFAVGNKWGEIQKKWEAGEMNTLDCLKTQMASVRITKKELFQYLSEIKIDPIFSELLIFLKKKKVPAVIVSDNFDLIIRRILLNNGLSKTIKVYSNKLKLRGNRLITEFPYTNLNCPQCAHCKKTQLLKHGGKFIIYAGDGLSDICPSKHADLVFAKARLLNYLRRNKKPCIKFRTMGDIYSHLSLLN